ncbi:MAG TPA: hypothetical protein PKA48_14315, partial [Candidatus Obscuribacter sp.]|nr:hypothetical protein [Candidatus Obscuribacter sp.]
MAEKRARPQAATALPCYGRRKYFDIYKRNPRLQAGGFSFGNLYLDANFLDDAVFHQNLAP